MSDKVPIRRLPTGVPGQQFEFFDLAKVNASVRFVNLATEAREGGLDAVLKRIVRGQPPIPGLHTLGVTDRGIQVFPRLITAPPERPSVGGEGRTHGRPPRLSVGVTGLDEMCRPRS